jgi:hypothetical protein
MISLSFWQFSGIPKDFLIRITLLAKILFKDLERKQIKISSKKALLFSLAFLLILFSACSGSSGEKELENIRIKELKERVNRNSIVIESMEASGNIAFDSPEQSGTGWIEVKIKKPDTVFVKIEGPFGISIANALITRNDFTYYNAQENKAITGSSTPVNIGAILRIKISFDELINGFTGGFMLNQDSSDTAGAESENGLYLVSQSVNHESSINKQKFYIDPSLFTVQKYSSLDGSDISQVEVNYMNYSEENASGRNVYFPSTIKIKNPGKNQSVYVDYVNKEFNKSGLTFKVKIPKSAKVIKWE